VADGDHEEAIKRGTPNIRCHHRRRRTADPAQHQSLRLPAGRHAVQRGAAAFARRPLAMEALRNSLSGAQLVEQRLGLFQIERDEPLGEPAIDRSEKITSVADYRSVSSPRRAADGFSASSFGLYSSKFCLKQTLKRKRLFPRSHS
jgi:hypothetical protein